MSSAYEAGVGRGYRLRDILACHRRVAVRIWHDGIVHAAQIAVASDTFASGPPWPEFARAMGIGDAKSANAVYVVGAFRAAPGHR
ncbi:MAG: hypothetical protein ACXWCW_31970, partial [Burkholderiales bacterium]